MAPGVLLVQTEGAEGEVEVTNNNGSPGGDGATAGCNEEVSGGDQSKDEHKCNGSSSSNSNSSGIGNGGSRADSPGYFTLSDSDGGSNPGTESPQNNGLGNRQQQQQQQVYKIFRSANHCGTPNIQGKSALPRKSSTPPTTLSNGGAKRGGGSEPTPKRKSASPSDWRTPTPSSSSGASNKSHTPPRPSPPKNYKRYSSEDDNDLLVPPRPPPPLSYTSTLPPPVPKKLKSKSPKPLQLPQQQQQQMAKPKRNSAPLVSVGRPLPKPQPLQVQSPSVMRMLTAPAKGEKLATAAAKRESPPRTFLKAFQQANEGQQARPSGGRRASNPVTGRVRSNGVSASVGVKKSVSPTKDVTPAAATATPSSSRHAPSPRVSPAKQRAPASDPRNRKSSPVKETPPPPPKIPAARIESKSKSKVKPPQYSKASESSLVSKKAAAAPRETERKASPQAKKSSSSSSSPLRAARNFLSRKNETINATEQQEASRKKSLRKNSTASSSTSLTASSDSRFSSSAVIPGGGGSPKKAKQERTERGNARSLKEARRKSDGDSGRSVKSLSGAAMDKIRAKRDSFKRGRNSGKIEGKKTTDDTVRNGQKDEEEGDDVLRIPPVHDLIRYYEGGKGSPVVMRDSCDLDAEDGAASSRPTTAVSGQSHLSGVSNLSQLTQLSQLSDLGAAELLDSSGSMRYLSVTEIDVVLDQYVSDMMGFARGAIGEEVETPRNSWAPTSRELVSMLEERKGKEENEERRRSVQEIIDKIERAANDDNNNKGTPGSSTADCDVSKSSDVINNNTIDHHHYVNFSPVSNRPFAENPPSISEALVRPPPRTKKKAVTPDPTEDDLSHGVFTEVSFAGSFVSKTSSSPAPSIKTRTPTPPPPPPPPSRPPIPSPRTKRKARKEQLLLEHKERGRQMLSDIIKSRSAGCVPSASAGAAASELTRSSSSGLSSTTGLDCLNELCTLSRTVERDIMGRKKETEKVEEEEKASSSSLEEQKTEVQSMHERTFLLGGRHGWGRLPSCPEDEEEKRGVGDENREGEVKKSGRSIKGSRELRKKTTLFFSLIFSRTFSTFSCLFGSAMIHEAFSLPSFFLLLFSPPPFTRLC